MRAVSILKTIYTEINTGKGKVFLLFLVCSFLAWAISKFSETYESRTNFDLEYYNLPDSLMLNTGVKNAISVKVRASGFQFLGYALNARTIRVNLTKVLEDKQGYFLTANTLKNEIEKQLPNRVTLLDLGEPIYFVDLYKVSSKKVPVYPNIDVKLEQNHMLQSGIAVQPESIEIKGPKKSIAKIQRLSTVYLELNAISDDFTRTLQIEPIDSLNNVVVGKNVVEVTGKVVRFSEKEFSVNIAALNTPEGYRLRVFPNEVKLICKAGIDRLKELKPQDFQVFVDYNALTDRESKRLYLELGNKPGDVFSVRLLRNEVEFVLEKL